MSSFYYTKVKFQTDLMLQKLLKIGPNSISNLIIEFAVGKGNIPCEFCNRLDVTYQVPSVASVWFTIMQMEDKCYDCYSKSKGFAKFRNELIHTSLFYLKFNSEPGGIYRTRDLYRRILPKRKWIPYESIIEENIPVLLLKKKAIPSGIVCYWANYQESLIVSTHHLIYDIDVILG